MVGLFHDGLGHERWRPDAFECRDAARPLFRSVHAGSVQLNDAVRVRRAAVANTTFLGVELVEIHPRDERVENRRPAQSSRKPSRRTSASLRSYSGCHSPTR